MTTNCCSLIWFTRHLRLEVDRWAKVESSSQNIASVNLLNNASDIEYELVVKQ